MRAEMSQLLAAKSKSRATSPGSRNHSQSLKPSLSPNVTSWDDGMDQKDLFGIMMMQKVADSESEVLAAGGSSEALQDVVLDLQLQIQRKNCVNGLVLLRSHLDAFRQEHNNLCACIAQWRRGAGVEEGQRVRDLKREVVQLRTCMATQATYIEELHEKQALVEATKSMSLASTSQRQKREALNGMSREELLSEVDRLYQSCDDASSRAIETQQQAALETQCYVMEVEKEFHRLQRQLLCAASRLLFAALQPVISGAVSMMNNAVRLWKEMSGIMNRSLSSVRSLNCSVSPEPFISEGTVVDSRQLESLSLLENENEVLRSSVRHFTTELEKSQEEVAMWSTELEQRTAMVEARVDAERQASSTRLRRTTDLAAAAMARVRGTGFLLRLITSWRGRSASDQGFRRRAEKQARRLREELAQVEDMERELARLSEVEASTKAKEQVIRATLISAVAASARRARKKERLSFAWMQWKLMLSREGTENAAQRVRMLMQQEMKNSKKHASQVAGVKSILYLLVTRGEITRKATGFQEWRQVTINRETVEHIEEVFTRKQRDLAEQAEQSARRRMTKLKKEAALRILSLRLVSKRWMGGARAFYHWAQTRRSGAAMFQEEEARRYEAEARAEDISTRAAAAHQKLRVRLTAVLTRRILVGAIEKSLRSVMEWWRATTIKQCEQCQGRLHELLEMKADVVHEETMRQVEALNLERDAIISQSLRQLQQENEALAKQVAEGMARTPDLTRCTTSTTTTVTPFNNTRDVNFTPVSRSTLANSSPGMRGPKPGRGNHMPQRKQVKGSSDSMSPLPGVNRTENWSTPATTPSQTGRPLPKHPIGTRPSRPELITGLDNNSDGGRERSRADPGLIKVATAAALSPPPKRLAAREGPPAPGSPQAA